MLVFDGFYGQRKIVLDDIISAEITKSVTEIPEAIIRIAKIPNISPLDRMTLKAIFPMREMVLFDGFISEIEADIKILEIKVIGFVQLLERKIALSERQNTQNVRTFLEAILAEWQQRTGEIISLEFEGNITAKCECSEGESMYEIFERVTEKNAMFTYDVDARKIIVKKYLGIQHENIFTYSPYHSDNSISEIRAEISAKMVTHYYNSENHQLERIASENIEKYGVIVSTSEDDKKEGFGIEREHSIMIENYELQAGDAIILEVIGQNYDEVVIASGWSDGEAILSGDYLSYFGEAVVLEEQIQIEGGVFEKRVEIGTKWKRGKTLSALIL